MKKIVYLLLIQLMVLSLSFSQEKTTIAVYNLRSSNVLTQAEVEILTNHLRSILIQYQKYDCLDRNRMEEILKEQGFQQSGCTSDMCAVEAGQLLGVEKMLTGSVGKFGKLFTIELQIIDIETSRIDNSSTYYFEGKMEQLLTQGIRLGLEKLIEPDRIMQISEAEKTNSLKPAAVTKEPVKIKQTEPDFGYITFNIVPSDAKVKIGNEIVSKRQMNRYKISAGTYDIQIYHKGYKKYTDVISVDKGENKTINKSLVPDEKSQPTTKNTYSSISLYLNGGFIEPWGDPGTGALFNMGTRIQGGVLLNIDNWLNLPTVLEPLTAEVMVGYGIWNIEEGYTGIYADATTNVISVLALGRYDVTDLILKLIGFEDPVLGIFGVAGLQYNIQSWDFPNWDREFDSASSFGLNLGIGVKYNLQSIVGKPFEIDLRFTQGVFLMGDVKDTDGNPFYIDGSDYNHTENGVLIGIGYQL